MKGFLNLSVIFILVFCFTSIVKAQNYYSNEIIVTATKTEVPLNETGSSVNVITAEEIEQKGKKEVIDLLQDIPGVSISRAGAFGGAPSIFIRGGDTGKVLVLIDGMRINDPMDINRGANLAFLTTNNIERIEIIKTPQSSLYGSEAQSIINIITKKGQGDTKVKLNFEAGSFYTFRESLNMSGGNDIVNYSLAIAREDSKGISKAENKSVGLTSPPTKKNSDYERDGYSNTAILSKLNVPLPMGFDYTLSVYYQASEFDLDSVDWVTNDPIDNPNHTGSNDTFTFNNVLTQKLFDWWSYKLEYGRTNIVRYDEDKYDPTDPSQSYYKGDTNQFEWKNDFKLGDFDILSLGYNLYTENGSSIYYASGWTTNSIEESAKTNSFFIHNHLKLMKFFFHTIGMRYDRHSEFGGTYTWNSTLLLVAPVIDTRLKGSYATSFKAPTIYQLYDSYSGEKDLDPENGKHYEIGIEQPFFSEIVKIGLTYFNNRYKEHIDYSYVTYKYENIGEIESSGYESFIDFKLPLNLTLSGSYTYTKTKDKETGDELLRRPKHQAAAVLNWSFYEGANLNIAYNYVGKRYDIGPVELDSYSTIDVKLLYWINQYIQIYGRIENAGNKKYQQINGYAMPQRAFYAGVEGNLL
ncbi:MAG: TonB-dependent receptor [Leptospirales bacterium]|nr:TonB-dependent receptor [Leptospirales bacterium]